MHAHHNNTKKKEMGLLFNTITLLSILLSALLPPPCASLLIQMQPTLLENQGGINDVHQKFPLPMVHRKLRFTEKVKEYDKARDLASQKQENSLAGKQDQRNQSMVLGNKGTRQKWMEGDEDPSQYFTMDYTRVRRRRPIHNKQLHVGP